MRLLRPLLALLLAACAAQAVGEEADPRPPGPVTLQDGGGAGADATPPADDDPPDPVDPPVDPPEPAADVAAVLDIYAMDVWAQPLPAADATLTISRDGSAALAPSFPVTRVSLAKGATYTVALAATYHDPLEVRVRDDGGGRPDSVTLVAGAGGGRAGVVLSHERVGKLVVHRLFLGLRHQYFAATARPARRGNKVRLLMDGEESWGQVKADLQAARETLNLSTWWFESTFELVRTAGQLTDGERRANTILSLLERSPAYKRVLINQFLGQDGPLADLTSDAPLRAHGDATGDRFEVLGQANETAGAFLFDVEAVDFAARVRDAVVPSLAGGTFDRATAVEAGLPRRQVDLNHFGVPLPVDVDHATWHQKFMVFDGKVAFVGGMNLTTHDWDTSAHRVFEPRRMPFAASADARQKVADKKELPDTVPAKDYMVRLEGPAVQDVEDVFGLRWDLAIDEEVDGFDHASGFKVRRDQAPAGSVQAQITTTMPDPLWEHGIAESWLNAVAHAEDFIFIEDQYFRAPMLNDAIAARMRAVPGLRLLVITRPVGEWTDVGCPWTARSAERFHREFPDRFQLLTLRAFDTTVTWGFDETESRFVDVYLHSKMLIVDDVFMSVGSANKNERGMIYEGEMNVAVVDPTWVRAARRRIFAGLLPGLKATDDSAVWWGQFDQAAVWNDYVRANWADEGDDLDLDGDPLPEAYTPFGMVYTLDVPRLDQCLLEDIGPDVG